MDSKLFRNKNLERLSSPEQLNEYMRVVKPSVWLVIVAVLVVLIGVILWGLMGTIESRLTVAVESDGCSAVCYIPQTQIKNVSEGMIIKVDDKEAKIGKISKDKIISSSEIDEFVTYMGGYMDGEYLYAVPVDVILDTGVFQASIILEEISPVSFLLNDGV